MQKLGLNQPCFHSTLLLTGPREVFQSHQETARRASHPNTAQLWRALPCALFLPCRMIERLMEKRSLVFSGNGICRDITFSLPWHQALPGGYLPVCNVFLSGLAACEMCPILFAPSSPLLAVQAVLFCEVLQNMSQSSVSPTPRQLDLLGGKPCVPQPCTTTAVSSRTP